MDDDPGRESPGHEPSRRPRSLLAAAAAALVSLALVVGCSSPAAEGDGNAGEPTVVAVHTTEIQRTSLRRWVTAYGRVEAAPALRGRPPARAEVSAAVGGLLVEVDCVEGARVAAGATLFRLDRRAAEVTRDAARKTLEFATAALERKRELLAAGGASERDVFEAGAQRDVAESALAAAETQLELLDVTAPISGTVVRVAGRLGQTVDSTAVLAEIVDLQRLVVKAAVPRSEARALEVGQRVELDVGESRVGESGAGEVEYVGADVDARTDTVPVRVSFPTSENLEVGALVELRILTEERPDSLAVPVESLVHEPSGESWIAVVEAVGGEPAESRAVRTPVTAGLREGGLVEVSGEGLREGLKVVGAEAYGLPPETRVRPLDR